MMTSLPPTVPTTSKSPLYVGIDYSITCPAVATYHGKAEGFKPEKINVIFHTRESKFAQTYWDKGWGTWLSGVEAVDKNFPHNEARFLHLATWAKGVINGTYNMEHRLLGIPVEKIGRAHV